MDDIPRYRKKAKKKPSAKSDHKHVWENCVYSFDTPVLDSAHGFVPAPELSIGTYCPVCGKIGTTIDPNWRSSIHYWPSRAEWIDWWKPEIRPQFYPPTRTLPFFRLTDRWNQKFVDFSQRLQ